MPLYDYKCNHCNQLMEIFLPVQHTAPKCIACGKDTKKQMVTPAFTFTNGKGTSGGNTMRIAGCKVPGGG